MDLDFIIQVECTQIDLNGLFPKKYCWYTVKKLAPGWSHSCSIEGSLSNRGLLWACFSFIGDGEYLGSEAAALHHFNSEYLCVPKPLCRGEVFVGCSGICHWCSSLGPGREREGVLELAQTVPCCSTCLCRWRAESSCWRKSSRTEPGHQLDCWSLG